MRREPHYLVGSVLKSIVAYLLMLDLRPLAELRAHQPEDGVAPIEYLKTHKGYRCLLCANNADSNGDSGGNNRDIDESSLKQSGGRPFSTTHLPLMRRHVSRQHGRKPSQHMSSEPVWQECQLQSYFRAKGRINYFVVVQGQEAGSVNAGGARISKSIKKVVISEGYMGVEAEEEK